MWKAVKQQKWLILYILVIIAGLFYFGEKYQNSVKAAEVDEAEQVEEFDSVMGAVPKPNGVFKGNLSVNQQMTLINQLVNLDPRFYNYSQYKEKEGLDYLFYKDPLSFVLIVKNNLELIRYGGGQHKLQGLGEGGRVYRFDDDMKLMYSFDAKEIDGDMLQDDKIEYFYSSLIGGSFERFFPLITQLNGTTVGINDYLELDADYSDYKYPTEFPRSVDNSKQNIDYRVQKKLLTKMLELEPNLYDFQGLMEKGSKLGYLVADMNNKYHIAIFNTYDRVDTSWGLKVNSNDMAVYTFDLNGEYMYKNGLDSYWGYEWKNVIYSNFYGTSYERLWKFLEYMNGTPEGSGGIVTVPDEGGGGNNGNGSEPPKDEEEPSKPEEDDKESGLGIWFGDLWDSEKYKFDNDFIQIFSMIGMYSRLFDFNYHLWNGGAPSEAQIEQLGPYWANYIRPSYGLAVFEINVLGVRIPMTEIQEIISENTYWTSMIFRSLITISTITYCYNKLRQTFAPMY